ncbi:hypothetical protein GCM10023115_38550 [Pontixanthobacter gangjinensis]
MIQYFLMILELAIPMNDAPMAITGIVLVSSAFKSSGKKWKKAAVNTETPAEAITPPNCNLLFK